VVAAMRDQHPLINVDLRSRPSSGTRQGLKIGEVDVGVLLDRPTDASFQYYELTKVHFRIAGPVAWKSQIESSDYAALARMPWITPGDHSMAYASILTSLFTDKGLELNSIVNFDNAMMARAIAQAGVGMMLMREEQALQGEREGYLAVSPIARPEYSMYFTHLTTRKNDPLIKAFIEAGRTVWPSMRQHGGPPGASD
jgi:DNA-binding transcriptional LysR family regulator